MPEHDKSLVKSSTALARFDPKARKELVVRGLNALSEVRDADFYFFKGEEHRMREELNIAISYYEKALQIDPEHEDSLFWMGYCYLPKRVGDNIELNNTIRNERAASAFQKLIDVRKKKDSIKWSSSVVYWTLGIAQDNLGLYEEAVKSYEQAIELNPYDAFYYGLGNAQGCLGLYEEAVKSYGQAIELNPDNAAYYYNLGNAQRKLGLYEEAVESYKQTIEMDPDDANSYWNLGAAQDYLELYKEALDNFKEYLRLENYELSEKQQHITYTNNRVQELKKLIEAQKSEKDNDYLSNFNKTGREIVSKGLKKTLAFLNTWFWNGRSDIFI